MSFDLTPTKKKKKKHLATDHKKTKKNSEHR